MSLGAARALTALYFTSALIAVTWPGLLPFARIRPFVLGLPLSMAWIAAWIAGSVVVLFLLDRVEGRYRRIEDEPVAAPPPAGSHPGRPNAAGPSVAGPHSAGPPSPGPGSGSPRTKDSDGGAA